MSRLPGQASARGLLASGLLLAWLLACGFPLSAHPPLKGRRPIAGQTLGPAPQSRVLNLTPHAGFSNEPSVAVNPRDPRQIVVAYQVPATAAYSDDGGKHWALAHGTAPENYRVSGDVSVTFDNQGHAFLGYIAFDKLGTENYWAHGATRNGIFVRRSLDGGKTWETRAATVIAHPTRPGIPFEDKPYLVADENPKSPYAGNLYIGWTQFTLAKSVILFSRSTDDGQAWSAPIEISSQEGLPRDDNGDVEGFSGAVAPDGTVYAVWADGDNIAFTYSQDGGRSFAASRTIIRVAPLYFKISDVARANGFPQLGLDRRTGRLFICWSDYRNGEVDVFVSTSTDQGATWSPEVRVNQDPIHDGRDHFFPWLAIDPFSGDAYVEFYDRQFAPKNRKAIVALARSTDGGKTFVHYAWTTRAFDPRGDFIGDYTAIAAFRGRVYGVWSEESPERSQKQRAATPKKPHPRTGKKPPRSLRTESSNHHTILRIGVADFGRSE